MSTNRQLVETTVFALRTGRIIPMGRQPIAPRPAPRDGDTYAFDVDRAAVEIVLGFRPGIDRLIVIGRAFATEVAGEVVLRDRHHRQIVLQGIALADMVPGDIEIRI